MTRPQVTEERYASWIAANVRDDKAALGACNEVSEAMASAFPELTRVRGFYYCPAWGERQHWWLVAPDGSVIDPTARQFPSKGSGEYIPWHEGDEEPTGKCINCGDLCFGGKSCCSDECGDEVASELNALIRGSR